MAVNIMDSVIAYFQERLSELTNSGLITNSEDSRCAAIDFYLKDEDGFCGAFVFSLEILDDIVWLHYCSKLVTQPYMMVNVEICTYMYEICTYMYDPEFPEKPVGRKAMAEHKWTLKRLWNTTEIFGDDGDLVAEVHGSPVGDVDSGERAVLIVQAVNNFGALVEALEAILRCYDEGTCCDTDEKVVCIAQDALAAARKER